MNVERRTWDKEKYATLAAARAATEVDVDDPAYEKEQRLKKLKEEQGDGGPQYFKVASEEEKKVTGSERAYLKARTAKVDGIGETTERMNVTWDAPTSENLRFADNGDASIYCSSNPIVFETLTLLTHSQIPWSAQPQWSRSPSPLPPQFPRTV